MNKRFAFISFSICIIACIGDVLITAISGSHYPGYSQISNTLSQLGADISPVSSIMSTWWTILGLTFVLLGFLIKKSFIEQTWAIKLFAWLMAGYGIGEGVCSGIFPVNYNSNEFDLASMLHIVLSGIGVLSVLLIPLVLQKVFIKKEFPNFYRYSYTTVIISLLFIGLFSLSKSIENPYNFFVHFKGLWQRLLSINFYLYFITLTTLILKLSLTIKTIKQE